MKIIVNVDDVGLHSAVGRAVEILREKGVVTSGSLVATGMDIDNAVKLEGVSLGVHLDILRGRPLTHWQSINSLVDENGSFYGNPVKLFQLYALGKVEHAHVETEWCAQIERVLDLGVQPTHLSSHKHVHAWPSLTRMAGDLAKRYGISWVRKPEDCTEIARLDKTGFQSKFANVCALFSRETTGVMWPDLFWGVDHTGVEFSPEVFADFLRTQKGIGPESVVELCCRPGVTISGDSPIPAHCNPTEISSVWRREFKSLTEDDWLGTFRANDCDLTDFGSST